MLTLSNLGGEYMDEFCYTTELLSSASFFILHIYHLIMEHTLVPFTSTLFLWTSLSLFHLLPSLSLPTSHKFLAPQK